MIIGFLTPEYPHELTGSTGGIGTSIKNLAKGLIAAGIDVRVLVYGQKVDNQFEDQGVIVQQIKNIKVKGLSLYLTQKKIENIIDELYQNKLIDVIEAPDWTGITSFIRPKKCPIVIRLHGSDTYFCYLDKRPVKWINKFHEKRALKNADGHLAVSNYVARMTNQIFEQNIDYTILHNGVDTDVFSPSVTMKTEENSILYFGTLIRKKGVLELPAIFNEIHLQNPSARLFLVGKDCSDIISANKSTWGMMQSLFSSESLKNVEYVGAVPYNEMKEYIQKATVCIFPSYAEAFPVSWLEAMAMKKAVVASNIGWAEELIIDGDNGFLVHPENHEKFSKNILEILNDEILVQRLGCAARNYVEKKFNADVISNQNIEYFKSLVSLKQSNSKR